MHHWGGASSYIFIFSWTPSAAPGGRSVHSVWCGCTEEVLSVVRFIRVRMGSLGCPLWPSGSIGFAWVHSGEPMCHRYDSV